MLKGANQLAPCSKHILRSLRGLGPTVFDGPEHPPVDPRPSDRSHPGHIQPGPDCPICLQSLEDQGSWDGELAR